MVPGFKVLLMGPTGTGKTYSLRTLIGAGITPYIIATEPGIMATLGDLPEGSFHYHYIAPAKLSWKDFKANATKINQLSFESLTKLKDMQKSKYGQFLEFLDSLTNFISDVDGKEYGCVDDWGTDRCLVVDSLSGLNIMAMDLVVGAKPVKAPGDWGVAMDNLERLITNLCCGVSTHLIVISHIEREKDEVTGGIKLMVSTLGQKLAPKIPRFFDNVIETRRDVTKFSWTTAAPMSDLKARHLPIADHMAPSFKVITENWIKKGGKIEPTVTPETD